MGNFSDYMAQNFSNETRKCYIKRLKLFKKDNKLQGKSKKYINQTKNALKHYYRANDIYIHDDIVYLNKLEQKAHKEPKQNEPPFELKKVNCRINALHDKRKKIAFRLMEISGLRISEISDLEPGDIEYLDNFRMIVHVRNGKGGKSRSIQTLKDKYVYEGIKGLKERGTKLFHRPNTLMKTADKLNFHTHDLRKVFSQVIYYKSGDIELLQKLLGHEPGKTYLKYINRQINMTGTKFDI